MDRAADSPAIGRCWPRWTGATSCSATPNGSCSACSGCPSAGSPSTPPRRVCTGDGIESAHVLWRSAIEASGFPGIHRQPPRLRRGLLDAYLQRIIDRDLPDHGVSVRRPETLRRWLAAYAGASSTSASYSRILDATTAGDSSQPAKTTLATATGAAMAGPLFESLVTLTVRAAAQAAEAKVGHLRTRNSDHEIDLIVEGPDGQVLGA
ncbi:MAG: DUF4143 domain-containing protein [Actinophytocola sp.]|nr:DUF4143 domain-containing protein [Actinophytocola sp.]